VTSPAARVRRLVGSSLPLAAAGLALLVAVGGAWENQPWVVLPGLSAAAALELLGRRAVVDGDAGLRLALTHGVTLRALVLLAWGTSVWTAPLRAIGLVAVLILVLPPVVVEAVDARLDGLRRHPSSRGLPDVGGVSLVRQPSAVTLRLLPECLLYVSAGLWMDHPTAILGAGAGAVLQVGVACHWAARLVRGRRRKAPVLAAMASFLVEAKPAVLLYAGDGPAAVHEVAVWLPTLERIEASVVVLMRSRAALAALPATTLPVLCVPGATDLFSLPLGEARAALFVSNIGNNIHLLRVPELRSAFIGHGDSDKNASANPFSKVYDEIWVAGAAGRERYVRAGVGIRPDALIEVGRPQTALIRTGAPDGDIPTVLYAPTWEGWDREQDYSSVRTHGPALVRAVLSHPRPLRLMYRPHPYTGRRDPAVAAAHRLIVALLEEANAAQGVTVTDLAGEAAGAAPEQSAADLEVAATSRGEERLRALDEAAHVLVAPGAVPLVSCFNVATALVGDVSSVRTDFVVSDKPLAVCDPRARDQHEFEAEFPSAAAATVLPPAETDIAAFLDVVTGTEPDSAAAARRRAARHHLLGPDEPPALLRFSAALDELSRAAASRQR
jgi:hypothetical protein